MIFDRSKLVLKPLSERRHDLDLGTMKPLGEAPEPSPALRQVARRVIEARRAQRPVVMMMGAHVLRAGVQRHLIDLLERGWLTLLAMNGACVIHDFELALVGATTESVARYVQEGQFGLWRETGRINDIVNRAREEGDAGMGEAVGRAIAEGEFPHREFSVLAACHRLGVPATVHIGIGYDIIHEHPNFDGAAAGAASYRDFLIFAGEVARLEGGVLMSFGSAVMAPEVFLKALAMARNALAREGGGPRRFTTLVADIRDLPAGFREEPPRRSPEYQFRPWKTLLVRTVAGGGESHYLRGDHRETVPALRRALIEAAGEA